MDVIDGYSIIIDMYLSGWMTVFLYKVNDKYFWYFDESTFLNVMLP